MKNPIYDIIGREYDVTRKADPEIARRIYNHLQISNNDLILDVACGTGNYAISLLEMGIRVIGTDISKEMIDKAASKTDRIQWVQANAEALPFEGHTFYGATCILAIHHFHDLLQSFCEVFRVLKDGTRFVIFTSTPDQMKNYWLNEYFPKMMERSMLQMPDTSTVTRAIKESGFQILGYETFMIQPNVSDFFLYSGKYRPEIYLRPEVRAGISSFAALSDDDEINEGMNRLESDISSGRFRAKAMNYISDSGDYLFVVAEKSESFG